ncbi:hypothetical protein BBJ28_00013726 [Nothophytophthora sp. Chile5]|nr:hypothetical protein BBJ28_00013726 [Nothophytophthora sp. Chile5]
METLTPPAKKRKATYLVRKEERARLQNQVLELQRKLASMQLFAGVGSEEQTRSLIASARTNVALHNEIELLQLGMAASQSLLSDWVENQAGNPVALPIHLRQEWSDRRETLLGLKDKRLARGYRYVTARNQHLDPLKPHFSEERFEDANGDFCCVRNEVVPFPGVQSLQKVFDALKFTLLNLEISISEQLGHITLREDYDTMEDDAFISNYRLVSNNTSGVTTELNAVLFGQYFESQARFGGRPCAILAVDSVDDDEVHPYNPRERVRKAITSTIVLTPVMCPKTSQNRPSEATDGVAEDEEEVVVVMRRAAFVKTCRPEFDVPEVVLQELRESVIRWGDVATQALREILYA